MESFMKTISDQHDEIHQLKEKLWSQHVTLDNQHTLIHGLQLQISNMKSEQERNLQNMKSEKELNLLNMKSEQDLILQNLKREQELNLQNMKNEQESNLQIMKSEQELKIELQRVQLEHLQKLISEMKSKLQNILQYNIKIA